MARGLTPKQQRFVEDGTCRLPLCGKRGEGFDALVDPDVYWWARHFFWFVTANGYVACRTGGRVATLHRIIAGDPSGLDVHHRNGDRLDARRDNLETLSRQEHLRRSGPRKNARSRFKGVTFHRRAQKWNARLFVDGRGLHLGLFATEEEAALAYDRRVRDLLGPHAWVNFPKAVA
jgi:hypothetical protein